MTTRNRELASIIDDSGNITAGGNLTVSGTTLTASSTVETHADPLIELNTGAGSNSNDLGFVFERGSTGDNACIIWDESNDGFAVGTTTATGTSTGNMSFTTADFAAGKVTVDNVLINGTTIGHTSDTDLLTLADGLLTVAGEISVTTLDIGGTNVTSTAAELNILDGVTSTAAELNILDGVTATAAEINFLDGDTSATSTTLAAADRVIVNDAGTMKQVALSDFETFFESEIDTFSTIDINGGSIDGATVGAASASSGAFTTLTASGLTNINNTNNTWGRLNVHENSSTVSSLVLSQGASSGSALEINDGNTDQSGNLFKVTGAGNTTIAGTLGVTGAVTANAGVVVDNITIDGTEIDLSSGDLTVDVAGGIILDADDSGTISFKDGGTRYGLVQKASDNFEIQSMISDGDLVIKGNDGGSTITALTLDMSEAGKATFNAGVDAAPNADTVSVFGRTAIGFVSGLSDYAMISHYDRQSSSNYALLQSASGSTYLNGTDVNLSIGGTRKVVVDSNGKVLIGDTASHTTDLLQIETPASGGGHGIQIRRNDANNDQGIGHILFGNNTATDLVKISAKTDGDSNAGDSGALLFHTQVTGGNLTERMRIDSAGKVGIGNSDPGAYLSIQTNDSTTNALVNSLMITNLSTGTTTTGFGGEIRFQAERNNGVNQNTGRIASVAEVNSGSNISSGLSFWTGSVGVLNERMRISYDGKVGIGTSSPTFTAPSGSTSQKGLHIQNSGNDTSAHLRLTGHNNTGGSPGQPTYFEILHAGDALRTDFNHNGTVRMSINSGGAVGINRTATQSNTKLEVGGADNVPLIAAEASGVFAGLGTVSAVSGTGLYVGTTLKFVVGSSGQIGINGANYGTSGQAIVSGGSGSAATWGSAGIGFGKAFVAAMVFGG